MSEWLHDPLCDRTVRIAPARAERPTDFASAAEQAACPFCAGAEHATPLPVDQATNARGEWITRVVPNLYPIVEGDSGAHEVVIESRRHASRFIDLTDEEATAAWQVIFRRLVHWRQDRRFDYVLMFKNEGVRAGASLEHVHSQIVALPHALGSAKPMWARLADGAPAAPRREMSRSETPWHVHTPVAPRTPYETWIMPADGVGLEDAAVDVDSIAGLARTLRSVLTAIRPEAFNLILQVAPKSAPAAIAGRFWLEVVPRESSLAGFELATGAWINEVSPADARSLVDRIESE